MYRFKEKDRIWVHFFTELVELVKSAEIFKRKIKIS